MPVSNTESLRRTDLAPQAWSVPAVATTVAAVLLTVAIVSLRPFQPAGVSADGMPVEGGDTLNQLGFGALGAVALLAMLCLAEPRRVWALFSPWWLMTFGFVGLSVMNAGDPASAMRTAAFTLIAIVVICASLVLPRDAESFSKVLAAMSLTVLGLSYAGLVLLPDVAVHTAAGQEPQHAGLWRGLFSHKNIAGPVMACISFGGFYLYRRGWKWTGALIFFAGLIFVSNTGSKTTAGLVPLAILVVALPSIMGLRRLTVLAFFTVLVGMAIGTLGIVFIAPVKDLAAEYFPGMTYSGRTALWQFAGEMLAKRPWTGYGLESFWGTPIILNTVQPFDRDWDIRTIVHGHNGYMDIAVMMGIPALVMAVLTFIVQPARDYMRVPRLKENVFVADFFMMALFFTTLNAFLESFFFRRADPVWLFVVFSAFGLRLAARLPMPTRA